MIAALYARFSSDNQREESIVAQLRAGREYCKRKGYSIIKEYADEAYTGTNDNRPGWIQMMKDASLGMFETLICHKIDRVGRNEYEYYTNKFKLNGWGVNIEFAAQDIDFSTPEGALMENQLAGFAAYYSRNLSKEVRKGLKENVLSGLSTGGKPAFGYDLENKHYVINEHEAIAVRYIFDAYLQGKSYLQICDWLNSHGYKTKLGNSFGKNSIHDMLCNRRYIGTCILGKNKKMANGKRNNHGKDPDDMIVVENACPVIVDKDVFMKVRNYMDKNKQRPGAKHAKRIYLLSGLVECAECGSSMSGSTTTMRNDKEIRYYRCSKKMTKGSNKCINRSVPADDLERLVITQMQKIFLEKDSIDKLMDRVVKIYNEKAMDETVLLDAAEKKEKKIKRQLNNIYDLFADGVADEFDKERLAETKKELLSIRSTIAKLESSYIPLLTKEQVIKYIEQYHNDIYSKDPDTLKNLINHFIEKIFVTPYNITIRYRLEFDGAPGGSRTHAHGFGGRCSIH